jgi:hypothetical protein
VRAGLEINNASDVTVRGNVSYHRYPFGWSEGMNLHFQNGGPVLVEHNVFRGASWMIVSVRCDSVLNVCLANPSKGSRSCHDAEAGGRQTRG